MKPGTIAFVLAIAFFLAPIPWWVSVLLVITMIYWLGPIVVFFTQKAPASPRHMLISIADPTIPEPVRDRLEDVTMALEAQGFRDAGLLQAEPQGSTQGYVRVLQHSDSGEVAHVLIVATLSSPPTIAAQLVGFSTRRANGTTIRTSNSGVPAVYPPDKRHDSARLPEVQDIAQLLRIHRHRASKSPAAVREVQRPIQDPVAFQTRIELEELAHQQRIGYWRRDSSSDMLRPTMKGALLMTLRLLPPWKQVTEKRVKEEADQLSAAA